MGLILKIGKIYTERYGHSGSSFYAKIGRISDVNKSKLEALFTVDVYLSKDASNQQLYPVQSLLYTLKGEDFQKWYSKPLMENQGLDPDQQLYLYLQTVVDPEINQQAWKDWQPDQ
ncbi:hypothetical protein [Microseira wollei]|uniref:Uncharacterized protein n=1 Tax=Microseira wollei NIES-4236 TaxID=2530354 RepID=A0AAV3X7M0_9CYAN|nr:hypothetical protein [Microseira wollei]GET38867.1 hypothetical protein MiSe_36260 [Microseira wollei NIES-4236]